MENEIPVISGKRAIKSGFWYTASGLLCKGIGFLTVPIIIRILGKSNYGLYSNFQNWLATFTIIIGISLGSSLISAKYDYKDSFDEYIRSLIILEMILSIVWIFIFFAFSKFLVDLICVNKPLLVFILIDSFFISIIDLFQHRAIYKMDYKSSVIVNVLLAVSVTLLILFLSLKLNNSLYGAVIGYSVPYVIIGMGIIVYLLKKGNGVLVSSWKYALKVCIPYIPHLLSLTLLNSLDKMMITKIRGSEENALYSAAYNCGIIVTILGSAVNSSFSPWLGENLNKRNIEGIRKVTKYYLGAFSLVTIFIMLMGPELLLLMGGYEYRDANKTVIPIVFGCLFQFAYTIFVDIEQFEKKTKGMAIASVVAALSNYILNSIYIPRYGYIAAAYTTLISYCVLLALHIILVWRLQLLRCCSMKTLSVILLVISVVSFVMFILYDYLSVRYSLVGLLCLFFLSIIIYNRDIIKKYLLKLKSE